MLTELHILLSAMLAIACGFLFVIFKMIRQVTTTSRPGFTAISLPKGLAKTASAVASSLRTKADETQTETEESSRLGAERLRKRLGGTPGTVGAQPQKAADGDYCTEMEAKLEHWFSLYERSRINEATYTHELKSALRIISADLAQHNLNPDRSGTETCDWEAEREAMVRAQDMVQWCLCWLNEYVARQNEVASTSKLDLVDARIA